MIPCGSLKTPVRKIVKLPCGSSEHAPAREVVETPGKHALFSFKKVPDGGPAFRNPIGGPGRRQKIRRPGPGRRILTLVMSTAACHYIFMTVLRFRKITEN